MFKVEKIDCQYYAKFAEIKRKYEDSIKSKSMESGNNILSFFGAGAKKPALPQQNA